MYAYMFVVQIVDIIQDLFLNFVHNISEAEIK